MSLENVIYFMVCYTLKKIHLLFKEGLLRKKNYICTPRLFFTYIHIFITPFSNNFFHIEKCLFLIISIPLNTQSKLQKVKYSEAIKTSKQSKTLRFPLQLISIFLKKKILITNIYKGTLHLKPRPELSW